MSEYYILGENHEVRPVATYQDYRRWRAGIVKDGPQFTLRVAADNIGDVHVSTVRAGRVLDG